MGMLVVSMQNKVYRVDMTSLESQKWNSSSIELLWYHNKALQWSQMSGMVTPILGNSTMTAKADGYPSQWVSYMKIVAVSWGYHNYSSYK